MERFCPRNHDSLVYARVFEKRYKVTKKLGLEGEDFRVLTGLYLADHTLMEEGRRLNREARNPGRRLWERVLPRRIYNCIYGLSIQELAETTATKDFVANTIDTLQEGLPQEDEAFAIRLRGTVTNLFAKGLIQYDKYKLSATRENSARIAMYRIQ